MSTTTPKAGVRSRTVEEAPRDCGRGRWVETLARALFELGLGDRHLQVYTPGGTPSLGGQIFAACGRD